MNTGHFCCITFVAISLSCQDFLGRSRGVIRTLAKIYGGALCWKKLAPVCRKLFGKEAACTCVCSIWEYEKDLEKQMC